MDEPGGAVSYTVNAFACRERGENSGRDPKQARKTFARGCFGER